MGSEISVIAENILSETMLLCYYFVCTTNDFDHIYQSLKLHCEHIFYYLTSFKPCKLYIPEERTQNKFARK